MPLTRIEDESVRRFCDLLASQLRPAKVRVYLFGSKARGDDREDSDVDLLVVHSSSDPRVCDAAYEVATDILLETGVSLSPKVVSESEYRHGLTSGLPFWHALEEEGVLL